MQQVQQVQPRTCHNRGCQCNMLHRPLRLQQKGPALQCRMVDIFCTLQRRPLQQPLVLLWQL